MTKRQRVFFSALIMVWLIFQIVFWQWWMQHAHVVDIPRLILNTLILGWSMLIPGYFFFFVFRMKKPNSLLPMPRCRVAMVVTKAPSEPFEVVELTLVAALAQKLPHDTWLADEDPSAETRQWCKSHEVHLSTRKGIEAYHRPTWPRRTKSKEGNLAYFYDTYGYARYDIVAQLDADHRPAPGYLAEMVRPFVDPAVGYVSAPSVCDANAHLSWAARARLYAESTMHGALQAGYSNGWAPLCIGSHYAVRTKALQQIGGLGPELAEDHSTTFLMQAHGFKGVHAFDAQATGDGPLSFHDCMTQEFQWSRSLVVLLLTLTPKHLGSLSLKLKFQFLFSQLWYPLFALTILISYAMMPVALVLQTAWMNVSYGAFLLHAALVTCITVIIVVWIKRCGWLRPSSAKLFSWEVMLFQLARWPWVLLGCVYAITDVCRKRPFTFKVTPKGNVASAAFPVRPLIPYVLVVIVLSLSALAVTDAKAARGYYFFALLTSFMYVILIVAVVIMHAYEKKLQNV